MKFKKVISVLLCLLLTAVIFSGCSSKESNIDLIYPFGGNINSYDPQIASTTDEFLIAENCFEGLVRSDDSGNITPGCATKWDVEDSGLKYTFHLQKGLHWYIFKSVKEKMGENYNPEITANDFVFALRRAVDPNTESPLYSTVSCIENAKEINSGTASTESLGVKAIDNYTLEITLSSANDEFLQTLSTAVAMPCNEEFFNSTNGRYGLDLMYTMFNGQFIVTNQLEASYILKNNSSYEGPTPAKAYNLTLKIVEPTDELAPQVLSGYYDAAYLRGYEVTNIGEKSGVTLVPYSDITWALTINGNNGIFANDKAREAICISTSELDYDKFPYLTKAKGFIPPSCTANGKSYTEQCQTITPQKDESQAVNLWKKAISEEKIYNIELTVIAPDTMEDATKKILQGIQSSIGSVSNVNDNKVKTTIKLEAMTEAELKSKVALGEYDIAIYPYEATSSSPVAFLNNFSQTNTTGFNADDFNEKLNEANSADAADLVNACGECEAQLAESYCYSPLFYESNYYAQAKGVTGVQFHPGSGRVSFINADRK